jgi:hypothetical protein
MHHYRQIILLFFFIVNRQPIVKASSIVNRQSSTIVNRQGLEGAGVQRSTGPKGQARDQDQTSPADPCRGPGTTTRAGAKGMYISHATARKK